MSINTKDPEEIVDFLRDIATSLQSGAQEAIFLGSESVYLPHVAAIAVARDLNRIATEIESWHTSE